MIKSNVLSELRTTSIRISSSSIKIQVARSAMHTSVISRGMDGKRRGSVPLMLLIYSDHRVHRRSIGNVEAELIEVIDVDDMIKAVVHAILVRAWYGTQTRGEYW
jgi:hypothetical protein